MVYRPFVAAGKPAQRGTSSNVLADSCRHSRLVPTRYIPNVQELRHDRYLDQSRPQPARHRERTDPQPLASGHSHGLLGQAGDDFILETYDWTAGAIKNNDDASDVRDVDLSTVHYLSGPVGVHGAEPGDLLVVDLLDIGAKAESMWGFNGFFSRQNGGGFLTDHFPSAQKAIWDFKGMFTSSRHIPGVNFAGLIHPGLIGCLPDPVMLGDWNRREQELIDTHPTRVPPLANAPLAATAHMGKLKGQARDDAAATGARTVPPREHGGNCDIKDLSRGSKIFFPVYVKGAGLSVGICTSVRATARSPFAVLSRWPAGCI